MLEASSYTGDVDTVLLLVSEVVTNAVRHAATPFELTIVVDGSQVTVGRRRPRPRPPASRCATPSPEDTSGRGLRIVEELAIELGHRARRQRRQARLVPLLLTMRT